MTTKIYDLCAKIGKYTGADGKEKGRWQNVGAVMQNDDGGKFIMLARWFNPAGVPDLTGKGGESILLSMFPPKDGEMPSRQINDDAPAYVPRQENHEEITRQLASVVVKAPAPAPTPKKAPVAVKPEDDVPF